jgi:hypothetical protein
MRVLQHSGGSKVQVQTVSCTETLSQKSKNENRPHHKGHLQIIYQIKDLHSAHKELLKLNNNKTTQLKMSKMTLK